MSRTVLIVVAAVVAVAAVALLAGGRASPGASTRGARPPATPGSAARPAADSPPSPRDLVGSWRPVLTPELERRIRDAHRIARRSPADAEVAVARARAELDGRRVEIDAETIAAFKGHERLSLQGYAVRSARGARLSLGLEAADGGPPSEVVVRKLGPSRIALVLPAVAPDYEVALVRDR